MTVIPYARGENRAHAKLTNERVLAIRRDVRTTAEIARDHQVCQPLIAGVKRGVRWTHVPGLPAMHPRAKSPDRPTARQAEILSLLAGGASRVQAARMLGLPPSCLGTSVRRMWAKAGVSGDAELIRVARERRWVQ